MTEIGEILNEAQLEEMEKAGLADKHAVRAASDEDLVAVRGIGAATAAKLQEWSSEDLQEGEAVSRRFLVLKDGDGNSLSVRPGDVIPAEFGAEQMVESGKARWR